MAAFVSSSKGINGANDTTTASAALSVTAGNLLVVTVTSQEAAFIPSTVASISDTAGNTWTACTAQSSGGTGEYVQIWYAYNCLGNASNVVTATWSAACRYKTIVQEQFSGADTTSGVLVAQNVGTSGATTVTSGSLVTTGDTIIVSGAVSSNDRSWTPGAGFTEVYDALIDDSASSGQAQYILQAGAGTYTASATASSASNLAIAAAAFNAAPSAPTINTQPADQTVNDAATATFTVSATTSGGTLSYQWKKNGSNVGTNSATYAPTAAYADQGAQITVDVTDSNGTTTSDAATLRVAFNLAGTGPRSAPIFGAGPFGAGAFGEVYSAPASVGGSVSASVAVTDGADTLTADVAPIVSASSATTDGADVLAANVDPVTASVSASVAVTDGADTLAAAVGPVVSASVAHTNGADVLAADVAPVIGASSATTDGADVLAAAVSPIVGITSATTDGADILDAAVNNNLAAVSASSATTDGADTLAAAVAPVVGVTSATTDGADVLAAAVDTSVGAVSASSATTDGADTLAAAVAPVVGVSSAYTDGADTLAAQVAPIVGLSSATTDGADTLAASVDPVPSFVGASVSVTEGADTLAAAVDTGTPAGGSHGFEIGGDEPKPSKRRGLVYVIEDDKPRSSAIEESAPAKLAAFTAAREQAEEIIRAAAEDHAATRVSKQVRYGNIRTSLKPLAPVLGGWNWINLYQRIYNEALVAQLREEIALEDAIDEDGAIAFLLLNL